MLMHVVTRKLTILGLASLAFVACIESDDESTDTAPAAVAPALAERSSEHPSVLPAGASTHGASSCVVPSAEGAHLRELVENRRFDAPMLVTQPAGESELLYVVERIGRVLLVSRGRVLRKPFLDIHPYMDASAPDRGLLGLAFHPDFATNKRFYVYYTPGGEPRNIVAEWGLRFGEPEEIRQLVDVADPDAENNGGGLAFGPDGYLYVGMGDGGGEGDPHGDFGHAQNSTTVFGSILRIDVDAATNAQAPPSNPYVGEVGHDLIWSMGVRNPWRLSFDPKTGSLFVADSGERKYEEISVVPPNHDPWLNLGWRAYEGFSVFDDDLTTLFEDHLEPVIVYEHGATNGAIRGGCAVVGGYVYRGDLPSLNGAYVFGDRCSGDIAAFNYCDGTVAGPVRLSSLSTQPGGLTSFGQDNAGRLYMTYSDGRVLEVVTE